MPFPGGVKGYTVTEGSQFGGYEFNDTTYGGGNQTSAHSGDTGFLTDGTKARQSPVTKSNQWIGWNKKVIKEPYVKIEMKSETTFKDVTFYSFGVKSESMSIFSSVAVQFKKDPSSSWTDKVFACVSSKPKSTEGLIIVAVSLEDKNAQFIKFQFSYSADWIVLSEITINEGRYTSIKSMSIKCPLPCPYISPVEVTRHSNFVFI